MDFNLVITVFLIFFSPVVILILIALATENPASSSQCRQKKEQVDIKPYEINKASPIKDILKNKLKKPDPGNSGFIKLLFGPKRDKIWLELSEELNGKFAKGKFWGKESRVEIKHRECTITLDSCSICYGAGALIVATRMRLPFITIDGFRFRIFRKSIFGDSDRPYDLKYINTKIGFPEFENNFTIEGNKEEKLIQLFKNSKIRDLIFSIPSGFTLDIKNWKNTYYPENVYILHFEIFRSLFSINDIEFLRLLFYLFAEIFDQLCLIGSACKDDPKVNVI